MIFALTITLGWWILPAIITLICLFFIIPAFFGSLGGNDYFGIGAMLSVIGGLLWCLPIGFVWAVYFAVMYFKK